jgi:hypothetical protein
VRGGCHRGYRGSPDLDLGLAAATQVRGSGTSGDYCDGRGDVGAGPHGRKDFVGWIGLPYP